MIALLRRALGWLDTIENVLIATLALSLVVLAGMQIVLRLSNHGLVWLDPLMRVLVIWAGLLGAVAAARYDKHIKFDVIGRLLTGRALTAVRALTLSFAVVICVVMVKASFGLIEVDRESLTELSEGVPMWWAELILPIAFSLLALRFTLSIFSKPEDVAVEERTP